MSYIKHGAAKRGQWTSEFRSWWQMKQRCGNPRNIHFDRYGGRGIKVCDQWIDSFANFREDMGLKPTPKHTLDRIDNDGNYEPGNCRWATRGEQARNRHQTAGERHHNAQLKVTDVLEIRFQAAMGSTLKDLSERFGVRTNQIRRIVRYERWKEVA